MTTSRAHQQVTRTLRFAACTRTCPLWREGPLGDGRRALLGITGRQETQSPVRSQARKRQLALRFRVCHAFVVVQVLLVPGRLRRRVCMKKKLPCSQIATPLHTRTVCKFADMPLTTSSIAVATLEMCLGIGQFGPTYKRCSAVKKVRKTRWTTERMRTRHPLPPQMMIISS